MNKHILLLLAVVFFLPLHAYDEYVNPFVGTDFHGHTYPGAIVPFGQIQPGPDTRLGNWDGCSGYHFSDDTIYGFSHTHLNGTGCEDYCDILLMPVLTSEKKSITNRKYYCSTFSHQNETATPGYYSVFLDKFKIKVELTTNERVAAHRYTFPDNQRVKAIVIDLTHRDRIVKSGFDKEDKKIISGYRMSSSWNPHQSCYFAIQTSVPYSNVEYIHNNTKAVIYFPEKVTVVEVYVAISGVDSEGAKKNLKTRGKMTFDEIRTQAAQKWEDVLAKIEVKGGTVTQMRNFYTALYHCYTSPYLWSDVDGRYRGTDNKLHTAEDGHNVYTVFSLWDTFRALHPLMSILEPKITDDFIYTMLMNYEQGGELTMWELAGFETHCMIGYHAAPVILDAYLSSDSCRADRKMMLPLLQGMVATSNRTEAHINYGIMGYLTSEDDNESVSKNLEYSYDDWCIAQFAKLTAQEVGASYYTDSVYNAYLHRSQSWMNIMDSKGFMHARRNGAFVTPFNPTEVNNHFTEANSWQYSTFVPHDIYYWAEMQGGKEKAIAFLDSLFTTSSATSGRQQVDITGLIGQYAHGNEPSHHAAYLYTYFGQPEKTERLVHKILNELYTPNPDGLCGNEDCGQMSAWYVMSAMGFYPVCPGSGEYVTVRPLFDDIIIHRPSGNVTINKANWPTGKFLRDWKLNDKSINGVPYTSHITPAPAFNDWRGQFDGTRTIILTCHDKKAKIYYTIDGTNPTAESALYTKPFTVDREVTIKAIAISADHEPSCVVSQHIVPHVTDRTASYITSPDPQYIENGAEGLVDHLHGTSNYRVGGWQGWQGDMEVIVDLLDVKTISYVGVECLESIRSWIFFPTEILVSISTDGEEFIPVGKVANTQYPASVDRYEDNTINEFFINLPNIQARYVKVRAVNFGKMPSWHISPGAQAWLFVDEIDIH